LRELFDRKASSVGGVAPRLPEQVRKRSRRRQLGTALVSAASVIALVVGSVGVLRAIDPGSDRGSVPVEDPWAGYEIFERTAKIGGVTVTTPSDWYLVNQYPWARRIQSQLREQRERAAEACSDEPTPEERRSCRSALEGVPGDGRVTPLLLLSDTDRGLETSPCFDPAFSVATDEAVMTIALDLYFVSQFGADDRAPWPVSFDTPQADDRHSCGPGKYVYFSADDIPYFAHFAFGDSVPDDERQTLITAFEEMQVEGGYEFLGERKPDDRGAYVIAGGENAAGPWRLELRPSTSAGPAANVELSVISPEGEGAGAGDFSVPSDTPIEQAGGDPTFGAVTKDASGVELRLEEGTPPIPAQVVPLPPSMPFAFDLFFASYDGDVPARAVPIGIPGVSTASPPPGGDLAELMAVHDHLETALHRLWAELAYIDELDGEVEAAQRDLDALAGEIGPGGPTEEQADRMMAYQDLIVRFKLSMTERQATVASLRAQIESLREARNVLVEESDPARFPTMVTVTCTGDGDGGTSLSGPAVLAQVDGVHIEVTNAIPNERVFLDLGTGMAPIEVSGGQRMELVLDEIVPRTLELVCTYETPAGTWRRPTHPLTVMPASS
jgi:hypothetical protein